MQRLRFDSIFLGVISPKKKKNTSDEDSNGPLNLLSDEIPEEITRGHWVRAVTMKNSSITRGVKMSILKWKMPFPPEGALSLEEQHTGRYSLYIQLKLTFLITIWI